MGKGERDRSYFERKDNTVGMLICAAVLAVVILVLCLVIWNFTHKEDDVQGESKVSAEGQGSGVSDTVMGGLNGEEGGQEHSGETEAGQNASMETGNGQDLAGGSTAAGNGGAGEGGAGSGEGEEQGGSGSSDGQLQDEMMAFEDTDDTVTAKETTNLRSEPSTERSDTVVAKLHNGETAHRTGVNDAEGWSRLEYDGQTVYAATRLLTTDLEAPPQEVSDTVTTSTGRKITFSAWDDTVTAKIECNLRTEPSTNGDEETVSYLLKKGENVHRTGMDEESGWSRVEYEGTTLYAVSSLLMVVTEEEE